MLLKGAITCTASPIRSVGFLLKPFPSPKEGRRDETSDKYETSQRVHCPSPLQNGGTTRIKRPVEKGRLDDQSRIERPTLQSQSTLRTDRFSVWDLNINSHACNSACQALNTLKPVTTLLRELGVRLVIYIDDILVVAESPELLNEHTEGLVYLLENLGL